ncbi:DUF1361 domain-containing protein [Oerskovia enterophila]|uniref:DUF1361 domain-containing protein n=1 Tax=Oerskovia enterophila TaxID=43678 RepID=A0A163PVP5_9CELL|nr:DUF1361 domain-containing protein [Oerskovia enterophila]KZM33552.1 hypothetical protein OJAG_38720 [Oerskovia enterophila]
MNLLFLGVILLNVFAFALVLLRAPLFRTEVYRPMLLNIGLSVLPVFVLTFWIVGDLALSAAGAPTWLVVTVAAAGLVVWLLLLPNAGYLVTELNFSHRKDGEDVPLWYDIVAVLSLAMSGVLNTVVNIFLVQMFYAVLRYPDDPQPFERPASWLVVAVVLVLVSFGIYLGRYIRFNSWDLAHPVGFLRKFLGYFRAPGKVRDAVLFSGLHTVFFALIYLIVIGSLLETLTAVAG